MRHLLDSTKENFRRIDFTEATIIDFFCKRSLPECMEFKVWGATLLTSSHWKHQEDFNESFPTTNDIYISGEGVFKIDGLVGGHFEVGVYDQVKDSIGRTNFAKNCNGSKLEYKRDWPFDKTGNFEYYLWECAVDWPYGGCVLELFSNGGTATFEFDDKDCIPAIDYVKNPMKYTYPF